MSASPLTKHNPALHYRRFPSGDGAARLPATHRPPIAPPTPSRDVRSNRPATRNAKRKSRAATLLLPSSTANAAFSAQAASSHCAPRRQPRGSS